MKEKPREKTPTLNTLGFLPPHQKSSDGLDAAVRGGLKSLDGHESAAGLRSLLHAESGASHGKDSPTRRQSVEVASDGRGRPSGAVETSGALESPRTGCAQTMDASENSPREGHEPNGEEEYAQVGKFLLVEEIADRREEIDGTLRSVEQQVTEQHPVEEVTVETVVQHAEELKELARLLQLAGSESAQEVEV